MNNPKQMDLGVSQNIENVKYSAFFLNLKSLKLIHFSILANTKNEIQLISI
jgi:hypothetical protein